MITGETTANGEGGSFYEEWENPESDFLKLFFGYQHDPDYSDEIPDEAAFRASMTAEEQKLLQVGGMKLGNIAWRRRQLRMPSERKKLKQEFPCTAEEAFLTSGRSPFNREKINDWPTRQPIETAMEGHLEYWVRAIRDRRYIVSVDCSSGESDEKPKGNDGPEGGTDYSSIGVWDCQTYQKVAQYRGKHPYGKLHHVVYKLGREYNDADIAIETFPSGYGMAVCNNLVHSVDIEDPYPLWMIHTTTTVDKKTEEEKSRWGWETTNKSKTLLVDYLTDLIEDEDVVIYSDRCEERVQAVHHQREGPDEAMKGYKDEVVMESMIGLYLIPQALSAGRRFFSKEELGV